MASLSFGALTKVNATRTHSAYGETRKHSVPSRVHSESLEPEFSNLTVGSTPFLARGPVESPEIIFYSVATKGRGKRTFPIRLVAQSPNPIRGHHPFSPKLVIVDSSSFLFSNCCVCTCCYHPLARGRIGLCRSATRAPRRPWIADASARFESETRTGSSQLVH